MVAVNVHAQFGNQARRMRRVMVEIVLTRADRVIGFRVDGQIQTADFDRISDIVEEKLKSHQKLRMYAEIKSLKGMSLEAFLKDLKFSIKHHERFEKAAIVSDKDWLRKIVAVEDKLLNGIEMKSFTFSEEQDAMAWITA